MSVVLLIAITTAFFDRINVAVLFTNAQFHADIGVSDPARMGLLMTAFVLPYGISAVLFSIFGDYFGPRRTLSGIAGILAATMALMGALSSYPLMLAGRVLIGITEGPQFGAAVSTVKRWYAPREQALGNAIWTIGSPLGPAIGFPVIIFLVENYGWRASFFALAALNALIVLPIVWFFLRDKPPEPVGGSSVPTEDKISFGEAILIVIRDPKFWLITTFNCGVLIYLWGLNSWLPTFLRAHGFDVQRTAFYSSLPYVLMIGGQFLFSWVSDAIGRRAVVCGFSLFMTGVFVYFTSIVSDGTTAAWCFAISAGFWGGTSPTLFSLGSQIMPAKVTAAGFGLYGGIGNIVGAFAPLIIGVLIASTGSFTAGLQFLVACCVLGSLAMIPLMRKYCRHAVQGPARLSGRAVAAGIVDGRRPEDLQGHRTRAAGAAAIPRSSRSPAQGVLVQERHRCARTRIRRIGRFGRARQLARDLRCGALRRARQDSRRMGARTRQSPEAARGQSQRCAREGDCAVRAFARRRSRSLPASRVDAGVRSGAVHHRGRLGDARSG